MSPSRSPVAFGQYIITRRIARGGMAEIYRARTRSTADQDSRWVAIKMMRSSIGHEDLREQLFKREARIASMIHHENVIPLFQFGLEMERYFIAMEYVRGRDLSHLLNKEKQIGPHLSFELGLYIGLNAAAGLGHAHRLRDEQGELLGIVHRDMSPGNVMVGYDGSVKVLDFGVARINENEGMQTQTGTLRGKFAYMSPEQTLGEPLDARSDVFSLGTVLYELLSGSNCFRTDNPIATLERVQRLRPVPPSRANREIPQAVDRILARCLAKDRNRRFPDGIALYEALAEFLDKRSFRGREALAEHMTASFQKEREEEERELLREEEEVALIDVVDFALVGEDGGLDAANVAVSLQEEASHLSVKRPVAASDEDDVFESDASDVPTGESIRPALSAPVGISDFVDSSEQKTVARSRRFEDPDDEPAQGNVELASLLDASTIGTSPPPAARVLSPLGTNSTARAHSTGAHQRLGAALPEVGGALAVTRTDLLQGVDALVTAEQNAVQLRRSGRPLLVAVALFAAVVGLATLVSVGMNAQAPNEPTTPAAAPRRQEIEPVKIVAEEKPERPQRERSGTAAVEVAKRTHAEEKTAEKLTEREDGHGASAGRGTAAEKSETKGETKSEGRTEAKAEAIPEPTAEAKTDARAEAKTDARAEAKTDARPEPKAEGKSEPTSEARTDAARSSKRSAPPPRAPQRTATRISVNPKPVGYLNVGANPWATITIDGKLWPYVTPQANIALSPGRHTITLHNKETGMTVTETVQIVAGTVRSVSGDMRKK